MIKNKKWIGLILSIILLFFCLNGFTYYKYTQESGANFYVGTPDKADALEDTNEIRQIVDDLGNLLGHSKRNDLYPKDGTTGGSLTVFNNYYLKTAIDTQGEMEAIWGVNLATDTELSLKANIASPTFTGTVTIPTPFTLGAVSVTATGTELNYVAGVTSAIQTQLGLRYLKTEIDTLPEMETIWGLNVIDSTEIDTFAELDAIVADKTLVNTTDKLSAFAATTSAELAGVISDETGTGALMFLNNKSCACNRTVNQAIPDATWTNVIFDNEEWDTDSIHDNVTNPERLTCKTSGTYFVFTSANFSDNATGQRLALVRKNGTIEIVKSFCGMDTGGRWQNSISTMINLEVNDYLELRVFQNSGADLDLFGGDTGSRFGMYRLP